MRARLIALVAALALAGCTMIPSYTRPVAPVPTALAGRSDAGRAHARRSVAGGTPARPSRRRRRRSPGSSSSRTSACAA